MLDEREWSLILQKFDDANILQTWPYASVLSGKEHISHVIVRKNRQIVSVALARIAKVPFLNVGIAYVGWGPLWRSGTGTHELNTFRQTVRALRNEYVGRRGLVLRLSPNLFEDCSVELLTILSEEGFFVVNNKARNRTILMDLSPSLEDLRRGMGSHWKRELKVAERNKLEIIEGTGEELFDSFIHIYKEMVSRKRFVEPHNIEQFRAIQSQLPETLKMKVMLCKSAEGMCAGVVCSAMGKTALYQFGATSNVGLKSRGSYMLQWHLVQRLKEEGFERYNLNGINPSTNPGTYKFKSDLGGAHCKDVHFIGIFDSYVSSFSRVGLVCAERLRTIYRAAQRRARPARARLSPSNP